MSDRLTENDYFFSVTTVTCDCYGEAVSCSAYCNTDFIAMQEHLTNYLKMANKLLVYLNS